MGWREKLITGPATFRGIPFRVDSSDLSFGRSTKVRDVQSNSKGGATTTRPADDDPFVEVGNKKPKQWVVSAHFAGDDYLLNRSAFIAAIEEGVAGTLQLPLEEPVTVMPTTGTVQFNSQSGGYEVVRCTFIHTTLKVQPSETVNTGRVADDTAVSSYAVEQEDFGLEVGGASFVESKTAELVEKLSLDVVDILSGAVGVKLDEVIDSAIAISQNARTLIQTPQDLAFQITDLIDDVTFAFTDPINAFNAQMQLFTDYGLGLPFFTPETQTEQELEDNRNAMTQIVQNAALSAGGRALAVAEFESLDQALLYKRTFDDASRQQQLANGDTSGYESTYYAIADLQAAISAHIEAQEKLPSNVTLTFEDQVPALVIAEDYYGDAERAPEIVTRNGVRNPLFCKREMVLLSE